MYSKNLSEDLRLRLAPRDMAFLRKLSEQRDCTVSECIRSIIGEYRRSLDAVEAINKAIALVNGGLSDGDTETYIHDKL